MNTIKNIYDVASVKLLAFSPDQFSVIDRTSSNKSQIYQGISDEGAYASTLDQIIYYILYIAGALAFIALVVGAWQYLFAAGDPQKASVAKKTITYAIIGIILIMLIFTILYFVTGNILGI